MNPSSRSFPWRPGLMLLLALALGVAVFFIPHPVAATADDIQSLRLSYNGEEVTGFDEPAVKEFLSQLSCHRTVGAVSSYSLENTYEIDLYYQNGPLHIVLSADTQFCYDTAGKAFHCNKITNGASAVDRLEYILSH